MADGFSRFPMTSGAVFTQDLVAIRLSKPHEVA